MFQIIYIYFLITFGFNVCLCFEDAWYSYQSDLGDASREELVITNVTTDENFKSDSKVRKWTSLSVGPICYSIGLMDAGLAVLFSTLNSNKTAFNITSNIVDLNKKPQDAILLQNRKGGLTEIVVIVSFYEELELVWYRIQGNALNSFWTWKLKQPLLHIDKFQIKGKDILLLINDFYQNLTTVDLYEYSIKSGAPNYWLRQSLDLSGPANSSAFNNFELDYYLSIPQKLLNSVIIYKFEESRFVPYSNISSAEVGIVTSFEIGFNSFLVIDGFHAGIYRFTRNGILREEIVNSNLGGIQYWLPVPVNTYRDEVLLFAQRSLDHGSHKTYVVDIFTYDGRKFEEHEDIPCSNSGEHVQRLTCLTHGSGIIGANYIGVGEKLGLIAPRISDFSFLFMIHFTIKENRHPKENEMQRLIRDKEKLQQMIEAQNQEYERIMSQFKLPSKNDEAVLSIDTLSTRQSDDELQSNGEIEKIRLEIQDLKEKINKLLEKETKRKFNTITINGIVEMEGVSKFGEVDIEKIGGVSAKDLLDDIVRKDSIKAIPGRKTFTDLEVDSLNFVTIDGIESNEIVTRDDSVIYLTGDLTFNNPTTAQSIFTLNGQFNDIDLENGIINIRKKYNGDLQFDNLRVDQKFRAGKINNVMTHSNEIDYSVLFNKNVNMNSENGTIYMPRNLSVGNINGENLDTIINQLCLVNIKCYIPGAILINGDISTQTDSFTQFLNKLSFPGEYIMRDSVRTSVITGQKTFTNSLIVGEIRCMTIDGLDTTKLITLSSDQEIPGKFIFKDVEVAEELNVSGKIFGEHIDKFIPNPTLQFVGDIKSNVNFKNLEVVGDVILENNLNGNNLDLILQDLIYKKEENVKILSRKDFPKGFSVNGNVDIVSQSINNINLDLLVTKDDDQLLNISLLQGDVIFYDAHVNGTYGGKNIIEMDQGLVKLKGEQYISSTLIFDGGIEVENLEIMGKLNDLNAGEYLYSNGDREIGSELHLNEMEVEDISVDGNLYGNLVEVDLNDFNGRYLSYSKDQIVDYSYKIGRSTVDTLNAGRINGVKYNAFFDNEKGTEKMKNLLEEGNIRIENLHVNGSIRIHNINNRSEADWLPTNLLEIKNGKGKELLFEGNVYIDTIKINKLGGVSWDWFIDQLYFKEESNLLVNSTKNFTNGFKVNKLVEASKLNGISIENILTKEGKQEMQGPVVIRGDVVFKENVTISENLSSIPITHFLETFNVSEDIYILKGDVLFWRSPYVHNLIIHGHVNNKNTADILSNLAYIEEDFDLPNETIFENIVSVSGNLAILQNINDINLSDISPRIVLITKDADIQGPVLFSKPVYIQKYLRIDQDLRTNYLYGQNLDELKKNAVFVDRGLLSGNYRFEEVVIKDDLTIKFLNGKDMRFLIPLRSNQSLSRLEFEEVTTVNDIPVGNLVNAYYLPDEFENTVMVDMNQKLSSTVIFKDVVLVRKILHAHAINDKALSKIVTTNTDQNLLSVFNFDSSKCRLESDFRVHGLLNGINITRWKNNSVKIYSSDTQWVYDAWNVTENVTFNENIEGVSLVRDLNLSRLMKEVEEKKHYKYNVEHSIIEDYNNICTDLTYLYESTKKQIYKFNHFEELQTLYFTNKVQHSHYFQHKGKHYLLVNIYNCSSHLMIFNSTAFSIATTIETGHILQVVSVYDEDNVYLVTRESNKIYGCHIQGTNIWNFDGDTLALQYNIEHQNLLQESQVPGTFYGLNEEGVIEYKIIKNGGPRKYRKWKVFEENAAFVPRGLKTGLSLRTGHKLLFLDRTDPLVEDDFSPDTESIIIGNTSEIDNYCIPGREEGDLVVTKVSIESARRNLLAVATHEETRVRGRLDFIKIYSDPLKGELFHKVPTYKPSSLASIEFDQGETLLAFMENERTLQVYEYKGIEGFKHRTSAKIQGSKLFIMTLPIYPYLNRRKVIGITYENRIILIQSVMLGNQIQKDLKCVL